MDAGPAPSEVAHWSGAKISHATTQLVLAMGGDRDTAEAGKAPMNPLAWEYDINEDL